MSQLCKARSVSNKLAFSLALCIKNWECFKQGFVYPITGWNNGCQIAGCDDCGDTVFIHAFAMQEDDCPTRYYITDAGTMEDVAIFEEIELKERVTNE